MKRARFLFRVVPKDPDRQSFLSAVRAIAGNLGVETKHPRWTSRGSLELDAFVPTRQDFEVFISAIEPLSKVDFTKDLDAAPAFKSKEEVIEEAVSYFNSERFWECHETLETVWRPAEGEEKKLVQGIILVCAAFVHEQRDERGVALSIFRRALPQLAWHERHYHEIDIWRLRKDVEGALAKGEVSPFRI